MLSADEQQQTRAELRANLDRSGWTADRVAAALGLNQDRVAAAMAVTAAQPADVWAVRDLLEEAVREAGREPEQYTYLPETARAAAEGWFALRPKNAAREAVARSGTPLTRPA